MKPKLKDLANDIINKYLDLVDTMTIKEIVQRNIDKKYFEGLERAEISFNRNFLPDQNTLNFIQKFAFDNVTKLTEDMKDKLRQEVSLGVMNMETSSQIKSRIRSVMDTTIDRSKMIFVTESNRASNMGHYQAARDSGLELVKKWDAQPERISRAGNMVPCKHCEFLDGQIVATDKHFKDDEGTKIFLPPHHPNCACRVVYIQKQDLEE